MKFRLIKFNYVVRDIMLFVFFAAFFTASCLLLSKNKSYTVEKDTGKEAEPFVAVQNTETEPPYITDTRTLSEYRGYLAVYDCFGALTDVLDIKVSSLPPADRELLVDGIIFDSNDALCDFIEALES